MSGGACKIIVCSWNELFSLPYGHALETALRHTFSVSEIARGVEDNGLVDEAAERLEKPQLDAKDQEFLLEILKKISG